MKRGYFECLCNTELFVRLTVLIPTKSLTWSLSLFSVLIKFCPKVTIAIKEPTLDLNFEPIIFIPGQCIYLKGHDIDLSDKLGYMNFLNWNQLHILEEIYIISSWRKWSSFIYAYHPTAYIMYAYLKFINVPIWCKFQVPSSFNFMPLYYLKIVLWWLFAQNSSELIAALFLYMSCIVWPKASFLALYCILLSLWLTWELTFHIHLLGWYPVFNHFKLRNMLTPFIVNLGWFGCKFERLCGY